MKRDLIVYASSFGVTYLLTLNIRAAMAALLITVIFKTVLSFWDN
jgi:uncharacterized membrane protein